MAGRHVRTGHTEPLPILEAPAPAPVRARDEPVSHRLSAEEGRHATRRAILACVGIFGLIVVAALALAVIASRGNSTIAAPVHPNGSKPSVAAQPAGDTATSIGTPTQHPRPAKGKQPGTPAAVHPNTVTEPAPTPTINHRQHPLPVPTFWLHPTRTTITPGPTPTHKHRRPSPTPTTTTKSATPRPTPSPTSTEATSSPSPSS